MTSAVVPVINIEKCTGCGLCTEVCSCGSLTVVNSVVVYINKKDCSICTRWCCQCELVCPVDAISCPFEIVVEDK
ncbi:4Fe-4S binding protein [Chloroflexota bacterium]